MAILWIALAVILYKTVETAGYREKTYEIIRPMLLMSKNVGYLLLFLWNLSILGA